MRGLEPGGKNHSTDSTGVGGRPMKAELKGELPEGADGDGCLGQAKDRPAYPFEAMRHFYGRYR